MAVSTHATFLGHSTVLLEMGGARILTDPILRNRVAVLRRQVPSVAVPLDAPIDAVVLSHLHLDHLDIGSLRMVPGAPRMYVPRGGGGLLRKAGFRDVVEIVATERATIGGLSIEAVHAVHVGHRPPAGPRASAIGFVIQSSDHRVWFAGDTDTYPGMAALREIDLALVPVWGWGPRLGPGHMNPRRAAEALALVQPRVAVPIHWGTYWPLGLGRYHRNLLEDPPHVMRSVASYLAPGVDVRVLQPGESTSLDMASASEGASLGAG